MILDRDGEVGSELSTSDFSEGDVGTNDEDDHGEKSNADTSNHVDPFASAGVGGSLGPVFAEDAGSEVGNDEFSGGKNENDNKDVSDETDEGREEGFGEVGKQATEVRTFSGGSWFSAVVGESGG